MKKEGEWGSRNTSGGKNKYSDKQADNETRL